MKQVFKRIISFSLSICIISMSFFLCPVSVYATDHGGGGTSDKEQDGPTHAVGKLDWDEMSDSRKWVTIFEYVVAQTNTVVNGDFTTYLESQEDFKEYVYGKSPDDIVTPSETGLTIPADLVALIKQALIEYSQETNGFYLLPTTDYRTVPAEWFATAPQYRTFKNIVEEKGVIVASLQYSSSSSFQFIAPFNDPDTPIALVCSNGSVNNLKDNPRTIVSAYLYGFDDWKVKEYLRQVFPDINTVYHTCAVAEDFQIGSNKDWVKSGLTNFDTSNYGSYGRDSWIIYSTTGEKMRVFVSASAMKNYSVGTRTVYFGKDFYDYTPADITATWDDINDRISHIDDILSELLDKIGDTDDEDKIADLLQEILDAIKNGGGGGNGDNQGGGNSGTGGSYDDKTLLSLLSGYFGSVLSMLSDLGLMIQEGFDNLSYQLGLIYDEMGDMTEEEVSDKTDSLFSQLFSAFSEIGDVLKGKFPFCLPNDLYTMLALLAGDEVSVPSGSGGGGDGGGDVMVCAYGAGDEKSESNAPVFEIPFVIGSADIEEKIIIDLSPFEYISKLSRTLMTLYYCACLMQLTFKVIDLGKDLGED